ncbi:hypothetical protein GBA52_022300 [Prunus armeniaca]|nr:hypothetical protein GBA52_022300 [Prunus armeniaca]
MMSTSSGYVSAKSVGEIPQLQRKMVPNRTPPKICVTNQIIYHTLRRRLLRRQSNPQTEILTQPKQQKNPKFFFSEAN